ncbi:hypothetical protein DRE_00151 [Drechslerella stenobrocha 248]|uniref:Uncharacterized protein n=1 Tax=Drechslerella stenobrocha 248 TaxID=1043628 RepID=W7HXB4_9PEZI|nr:hypothetical protein DRE_00151 [Drechslerella stenobrocha 248]
MFATLLKRAGPAIRSPGALTIVQPSPLLFTRGVKTLPANKSIYIHPLPPTPQGQAYALSYLPTYNSSATSDTSPAILGHTTAIPPTPSTFTENPAFRKTLLTILHAHAAHDPAIRAEAFAAWCGSMRRGSGKRGDYAPVNVGGFHNVIDGRVAGATGMRAVPEPQDILGSVAVDGDGQVLSDAGFEACESWRVVTADGVGQLTEYLEEKLVEALQKGQKEGSG